MPRLAMRVQGDQACIDALKELNLGVQKDIVRQAVRSAMGPIAAEARKNIKKATKDSEQSTGHLYRNIAVKVKQHRQKPWLVYGLVGAKRGPMSRYQITYSYRDKRSGKVRTRTTIVKRRASSYLHLLEKGFVHYLTGAFVPGRHMLRNAIASKKEVALQRFSDTLRRLIPKHVERARARGRTRSRPRYVTQTRA
jgi:HK97 gp10 family phage protein